jgi:hypothetical protein
MFPSTRRRRRFVPDVRLVIGLVLVAVSVAGVVAIVAASDRRTVVYAAASALSPGDRIRLGDLVERSVALDGADELYLAAGDLPADGLIVRESVRDGELVPRGAVGGSAGLRATAIVILSSIPVSGAVTPGSTVDVWAAPASSETGGAAFGPPAVLVPDAVVVRVIADDGLMAGTRTAAVEVLVPRSRVARVLHSLANADALAVVPAGLPLER